MPVRLSTVRDIVQNAGIKALVYGPSGVGKTRLCATSYCPVIISAEGGLLTLMQEWPDVPAIEVASEQDCYDALALIMSPAGANFHTVCLDSITEIAEVVLSHMKANTKDGRAAYGEMNDRMAKIIRMFRDIRGKHVLFTAKETWHTDDVTKITKYYPSMPGNKLTGDMPYFFDEVFRADFGLDAQGRTTYYLQTKGDIRVTAKDRGQRLLEREYPDFTTITSKCLGLM